MGPKKFINVNQNQFQFSIMQTNAASWVKHTARWVRQSARWRRQFNLFPVIVQVVFYKMFPLQYFFLILVQWPKIKNNFHHIILSYLNNLLCGSTTIPVLPSEMHTESVQKKPIWHVQANPVCLKFQQKRILLYTLHHGRPLAVLSFCVNLPGMLIPPLSHLWALRNKTSYLPDIQIGVLQFKSLCMLHVMYSKTAIAILQSTFSQREDFICTNWGCGSRRRQDNQSWRKFFMIQHDDFSSRADFSNTFIFVSRKIFCALK